MIAIVELYLKELVEKKINIIKSHPDIIDEVFNNADYSDRFKTFLSTKDIKVLIGFPRSEQAVLPCISIHLGSDDEEFESLGDYQEFDDDDELNLVGSFNNSGYRLECWADNAELVVLMYKLLQFILIINRTAISRELNVVNPRLSGGDLEPLPDYFPVFVYRRAIVFSSKIENCFPIEDKWGLGTGITGGQTIPDSDYGDNIDKLVIDGYADGDLFSHIEVPIDNDD